MELAESVTDPLADARGLDWEGISFVLVGLAGKVAAPLAYSRGSVQNKWRISGVGRERNRPTC